MRKFYLAICLAAGLTCCAQALAAPPQDTRTRHEDNGLVDGVRWGSEPYEPTTPKPDYGQKLKRGFNRDPDAWRVNRTNRRDNSENSPNK